MPGFMETIRKAVDSLVSIGCGQRELIIGDCQKRKKDLALVLIKNATFIVAILRNVCTEIMPLKIKSESLAAFPIIETHASHVSSYVPGDVISFLDGTSVASTAQNGNETARPAQ